MAACNVFLNYRRSDTAGHAGRLFDRLNQRFPGRIFRDVTGIGYGAKFAEEIERKLDSCQVLIVLIGPSWLTAADKSGRRIDNKDDFVRVEIESGLRRDVLVIPVLVGEAPLPSADDLPESLKPLAGHHALEITEPDFDNDVERLIRAIAEELGEPTAPTQTLTPHTESDATRTRVEKRGSPRAALVVGGLVAAALVVCAAALLFYASSKGAGGRDAQWPAPAFFDAAAVPDSFDAVGAWDVGGAASDYRASVVMSADHTYSAEGTWRGVYDAGAGTWEYGPTTRVIIFHFDLPGGSVGTTRMEIKAERDGLYRATHSLYGDLVLRRTAPR